MSDNYTPYFTLETRGQGLIGLMTCSRCGSAVLSDATKDHDRWHLLGASAKAAIPTPPSASPQPDLPNPLADRYHERATPSTEKESPDVR